MLSKFYLEIEFPKKRFLETIFVLTDFDICTLIQKDRKCVNNFQHSPSHALTFTCLIKQSSSKWRVTVSGQLMFSESYGNCDVTITVTLLL